MTKSLKVVGIGNAIVDVLARVQEDFLASNGVEKGIMTLIDTDRATELYAAMGPARELSGGSAANTIAGLGMLGAPAGFIGKVRDDQLGRIFAHDIRSLGIAYDTPMAPMALEGPETGRCMVLVTPDGERSMSTYLGVSADIAPDDINGAMIADAEWIYLEGYRFDGPESQEAFARAIAAARSAGGKVALTVSDPFCIERHRDAFAQMIRNDVDLLFANEAEMHALYQTDDLEVAMQQARAEVEMVACTIGPKGAWMLNGGEKVLAPPASAKRVDATGAGDLFATGVLYGLVTGSDLETAGRMGCLAAGSVISHIGARPEEDLRTLFTANGFPVEQAAVDA